MRIVAICATMTLLAYAGAFAQGTGDTPQNLCMLPTYAERMACLEKLAGQAPAVTPPPRGGVPSPAAPPPKRERTPTTAPPAQAPAPAADGWVVSQTQSPLDYSSVVIATASSSAEPAGVLQLSVVCRGGRTEMAIRSGPRMRRVEDYSVSYSINGASPVGVTIGPSSASTAIALKGDVAGFLKGLPAEGAIAFRLAERQGATLEARYDLPGIKALVAAMAGPCKWP